MKKLGVKLGLDVILGVLLVLMYRKGVISMAFHEIGGLVLLALFLVHLGFNWRWIGAITKRLFDKQLPAKTRLGYLVNLLLLVCFVSIGVSGVMISKVVFHMESHGSLWKILHYFPSALTVILIGVHIGLHWGVISGFVKKRVHLPKTACRVLGTVVLCGMLVLGVFGFATTSFAGWLQMPFSTAVGGGMRPAGGNPQETLEQGNIPTDIADNSPNSDPIQGETRDNNTTPDPIQRGHRQNNRPPRGNGGENFGRANENAGRGEGYAGVAPYDGVGMRGGMQGGRFSVVGLMSLLSTFGGMVTVFAALTVALERMIKKSKTKRSKANLLPP